MEHAEVRERLADAIVWPREGGIDALLADAGRDGGRLRAHLAGCEPCRRELEALRFTGRLLEAAAPDSVTLSPEARPRILDGVRSSGIRRAGLARPSRPLIPSPGPTRGFTAVLAAAAVLLLAAGLGAGLVLLDQRDRAQQELAQLTGLADASRRVLADPAGVQLSLSGPTGQGTLLLAPTSGEVVVTAAGLPTLPAGQRYDCFIERAGVRTWVGWMRWTGDLAWWWGPTDAVARPGQPGDRFLVAPGPAAEAVLAGGF